MRKIENSMILILILSSLMLVGCSDSKDTQKQGDNSNSITSSDLHDQQQKNGGDDSPAVMTQPVEDSIHAEENVYYDFEDFKFSDGYGLVKCTFDGINYIACIDKTGKMLFRKQIPDSKVFIQPFHNGCAYVHAGDYMESFNANGDCLHSVESSETHSEKLFEDGYYLTVDHVTSFDSATYEHRLYDRDGNLLTEWDGMDGSLYTTYSGAGVFKVAYQYSGHGKGAYYASKTDNWIEIDDYDYFTFASFDDENAYISLYVETLRKEENGCNTRVYFMDSSGNITTDLITTDTSRILNNSYVHEGYCLFAGVKYFATYNMETKDFNTLDDETILNRMDWDNFSYSAPFDNGHIAVPLIGADMKHYVSLLDTSLNPICEPIEASGGYSYSNGRLVVNTDSGTTVYDENGIRLFALSDIGFSSYTISAYSDGIAMITLGNDTKFIDKSGNLLFDRIDTSSVVDK